ncbi:MAG: YIP1 family protein [Anaerolineaceae bacterium]|nr:YIP1 family protein [Anaerolineaceae bacterium]
MTEQNTFDINKVIADAKLVITAPTTYFQGMPKTGGLTNPLIFILVMAVTMGIITAILSFFGSAAGMLAAGIGAVIFVPIAALIGAFIGSAILFVIWKLMGSEQNYEVAFRCFAAATAIYPVIAILAIIPYIGSIIGVIWGSYLMIEASVAVHGRERKTATMVFGILAVLLILSNISSEYASRKMADRMEEMGSMLEDYENLPPDEAGKKMGEFLKGMEQGMGNQE